MKKFKFESGDTLFYVNPYIFTIELIRVDFVYEDELGIWYIEQTGAYLAEHDLFKSLDEARKDA